MREANVKILFLDDNLLQSELAAALGIDVKQLGISTYGPDRPISIFLPDNMPDNSLAIIEQVCALHDPTKAPPKENPETMVDVQTQIDALKVQIATLQAKG